MKGPVVLYGTTEWGQSYWNTMLHVVVSIRKIVLDEETGLDSLSCSSMERGKQTPRGYGDEDEVDEHP